MCGMLPLFRSPLPSLVKTFLELLLVTEVVLHGQSVVTVTALFPTWLRGALKKGLLRVLGKTEAVPAQLQRKRTKV